jgi:L-malate glycosyltransferase
MKILYVSDSTTVSGAEIVMLGYLDGLKARGDEAFGFMSDRNPRLMDAFRERGAAFTATGAYSGRILETTANPAALSEFARALYRASAEMADVIREAGIDLVHSISYPASLYAAIACARTGIRQVWHEHNIKRLHPVNKLIYRRVSHTCRWVIGPSDAVTDNLGKAGIEAHRLRTVYNGIDLNRFQRVDPQETAALRRQLGVREGEAAVGLFGQMLPYKGHRTLIEAAPEILRRHPNTRFFLVGALENPPYEDELRRLIAAGRLDERFVFTGWRSDVQHIVRAMDVVVVGTTTPEPAALMLMEGAAMERAVVATRTGGTPELLQDGETGFLFEPGNAPQLAERVSELLARPDLALELGRTGRRRVEERFSRDRHLSEMFGLYERAISES